MHDLHTSSLRPQLWFPPDEQQGLFDQYCRELAHQGITYIWHNLVKDGNSVSLVSDKDWAHRYLEGNCTQFDIVDHFMYDRGINFFLWRDIMDHGNDKQIKLMQERECDYRIFNGLTISLEHRVAKQNGTYLTTHRETLSLATDSRQFDLPEFCLTQYPLICEYLEKLTSLSSQLMTSNNTNYAGLVPPFNVSHKPVEGRPFSSSPNNGRHPQLMNYRERQS